MSDAETYQRMFTNRLNKKNKHLKNWIKRDAIQCYRLYDADMPEFAFAVDVYHGIALDNPEVGQQRWGHVQEYEAPKTVNPEKVEMRRHIALSVIADVLELDEKHLIFKTRRQQKGKLQYEKLGEHQQMIQTVEGGLHFLLNLHDYLDTGLFLDHRTTRDLVRRQAQNTRFLNLFAYTGSVSVYAAAGGAQQVTTVDMSNTYLNWARKNMMLNGMNNGDFEFIHADCLQWLSQHNALYDFIFLDPPSYSSSKRMQSTFDVQRDQVQLIEQTMEHLSQSGQLLFSNNRRGFKLDSSIEKQFHVKNITQETIPKDFEQNRKIHQCWIIQHTMR